MNYRITDGSLIVLPFDLRGFIMNIDEYEVYARERRLKSKIAVA